MSGPSTLTPASPIPVAPNGTTLPLQSDNQEPSIVPSPPHPLQRSLRPPLRPTYKHAAAHPVNGPYRRARTPRPRPLSRAVHLRHHYAYTCTFCWETYRASSTSSPRVVGTNARIACEACWVQLHNLSICWACGDSVVRGEECVSFGWTFWHRGCFGCLSCRALLKAPGDVGEFAVEVFETPVCEKCQAEDGEETHDVPVVEAATGGDGCEDVRQDKVLQKTKAAEMAGKLKGGRRSITRRSRRQHHGVVRDIVETTRRQGADAQVRQGVQSDETTNTLQTDGSRDGTFSSSSLSSQPPTVDSQHRAIASYTQPTATRTSTHSPQRTNRAVRYGTPVPYVSIFDPLNTPAFKPVSRSKRPPKWTACQLSSVPETTSQQNQPTQQPAGSLPSREVQGQLPGTAAAAAAAAAVERLLVAPHDKNEVVVKKRRRSGGEQRQPAVSFARDPRELPFLKSGRQPDGRKKLKSRKATPVPATFVRKEPPPYPYFQSARRPIVPAVESSWNNSKMSPGLFPYAETTGGQPKSSRPPIPPPGGPAVKQRHRVTSMQPQQQSQPQPRVASSFKSTEYLDKYRDGKGDAAAAKDAVEAASSCPCCDETITTGSPTIDGTNGRRYHVECFVCRICGRPVDAKGKMDDCLFLMQVPHHRRCVYEKAGPAIEKQRQRSLARRQHQYQQRKVHQHHHHHHHQQQQPQQHPPSTTAVAASHPKSHTTTAVVLEPPLRTQKGLTRELSAFFSSRKRSGPAPPPPATTTATATAGGYSEPSCAGCGKGLASSAEQQHEKQESPSSEGSEVSGPDSTRLHRSCMRCQGCGVWMVRGAARRFEWDAEGLMVLLCR